MKSKIIFPCILAAIFLSGAFGLATGSRAQRPQADIKITYKMTMPGGMQSESTTLIKGARERSEQRLGYGMDLINITQCDLRQTIQLSHKTKKYIITPMEAMEDSDPPTTGAAQSRPGNAGPSRRGGVITSVMTSTDTGERKQMFGFTARHVRTSIRMESSPDACNPVNMHMEQDGWYIDLNFGLNCDLGRPPVAARPATGGGCQDRFRARHVGTGRTGFPLVETTIGYDKNDQEQFRITKEVVDLSRAPLDAALFDVPAGYTEARSSQELYAINPGEMIQQALKGRQPAGETSSDGGLASQLGGSGAVRIGVVQLNNKTKASLSTEELRGRLVGDITNAGVEAIPLNAISLSEAQTEAKEKGCNFILLTDISSLKAPSAGKKIGGLFGRATGVDTGGAGKSEAKLDFKLFPTGSSAAVLSSSESAKEDSDDSSVSAALEREAAAVVAAARK